MTRLRLVLLLILLLPFPLLAQTTGQVTGIALDSLGNTVGGATITVCALGSSGIPCAPVTASTTSNGQGAFSVTVPVGTYTVTVFRLGVVATSSTVVVAPSNITVPNNIVGGTASFTNLTVSGTATVANIDGTIYCDGVVYTSLNAANTAALLTPGVGIVISNGSNCPVTSNLTIQTNTPLTFKSSNAITIPTGVTLTIGGPINAPPTQLFNLQGTGKVVFAASAPQAVTVYPQWWGALCNSTNDDTNAFQQALNAIAFFQNQTGSFSGGTVMIPAGVPQACKVSTLNMDNMVGVTVRSGMGNGMGNNQNPSITFSGNCTASACLSMRSAVGINFYGLVLNFASAANPAAGMIDMEHCAAGAGCNGNDTAYIGFHGVQFKGPGSGTIINARQTDFITYDGWTVFSNAAVFVNGSCQTYTSGLCTTASNSEFSDHNIFRDVNFSGPTTAAIQNASASWQISSCEFQNNNVVSFLNFSGGYTQMQDLLVQSLEETGIPAANGTAFTMFNLPAVSGNAGGITIEGSLLLGSTAQAANQILLSLGNGQIARLHGNTIQFWNVAISLGTGVTLNVDSNLYQNITTFKSGTPQSGIVTDNAGVITMYSGTNNALQITNGQVAIGGLLASQLNGGTLFYSTTAPTIAAAGCGGGAASVSVQNGTLAFKINVGTTPGSACTFTMPAATTGWNCFATDITTNSTSVFLQKQTGVESTTSVTITNFNDVAVATAFTASDILKVACTAD